MNKLDGQDKPISEQINVLRKILELDEKFMEAMRRLRELDIPKDYYVMSGWPVQIVANYYAGEDLAKNVKECDIVYWEDNLSEDREKTVSQVIIDKLKDLNLNLDIANEARVHLWLPEYCGIKIEPYKSVEEAIASMTETITCLGVRLDKKDELVVFAPYGLNDIFEGVIRPLKDSLLISKGYYTERALGKQKRFPGLKVLPF